eukprot:m.183280 g.183280  ORF g.183280 m.183280 type:complete len:292 (+) comp15541_c0_seq7:168-1043(+)
MWMEELEEYIEDKHQVVTYKSLSHLLQVPVNVAKQMLFHYLSHCQKNDKPIFASFFISGLTKDGSRKFLVVNQDELEGTRAKFRNITTEHVYSLQKGNLKDLDMTLYASDLSFKKQEQQSIVRFSGISCTNTVEHVQAPSMPIIEEQFIGDSNRKRKLSTEGFFNQIAQRQATGASTRPPQTTLQNQIDDDDPEIIEIRHVVPADKGKRKRGPSRKVEKSFINDEGYMVSELVDEVETEGRVEESYNNDFSKAHTTSKHQKTVHNVANTDKAAMNKAKKRQSNLMGFFNKK